MDKKKDLFFKDEEDDEICQDEKDDIIICHKIYGQNDQICRSHYTMQLNICLKKYKKRNN